MKKQLLCSGLIWFAVALITLSSGHANSAARTPATEDTAVLVGAGDIADCRDLSGAEATAKLLDHVSGTVMADGDLAYPDGTKENFVCYDKTWGRVKSRTRPAPGNHEFHSSEATPYFDYFGKAAGDTRTGYYTRKAPRIQNVAFANSSPAPAARIFVPLARRSPIANYAMRQLLAF